MNEEFNTNETRSRGETERGDREREERRLRETGAHGRGRTQSSLCVTIRAVLR